MSLRMILFLVVVGAQMAVPLSFILKHERTLSLGEIHRFRTVPIDPVDPFQGRYVIVNLADREVDLKSENEMINLNLEQRGYARVEVDSDGFSHFSTWNSHRPTSGSFLRTKLAKHGRLARPRPEGSTRWPIEIPFNRFYMAEAIAPLAERLVRSRGQEIDCWVEVKLYAGHAVITDLYVDGIPVREAISRGE